MIAKIRIARVSVPLGGKKTENALHIWTANRKMNKVFCFLSLILHMGAKRLNVELRVHCAVESSNTTFSIQLKAQRAPDWRRRQKFAAAFFFSFIAGFTTWCCECTQNIFIRL